MTHQTGTTIASSPSHGSPERQREIALIGNPNTGKTTLFNRLTGARQRVGNYPGVTVEKKLGTLKLGDHASVAVIDLPGAYSLAAASADERVVLDVLMGRIPGTARPDVVVCVVDASNLMRNLFLASQVADTGIPQVVALNMMDCAREQGVAVDPGLLSQRLGVPVVPITATRGEGVEELKRAIHTLLSAASSETLNRQLTADNPSTPGIAPMPWPASVEQAVGELDRAIRHDLGGNEASSVSRVELLRLLFDAHSAISERLGWPRSKADAAIARARTHLEQHGLDPVSAEAMLRYGRLAELLEGVIVHPGERKPTRGESADRVLTHRVWGLLFFVGLMTLVFQSIYTLAGPLMDGIDALTGWMQEIAGGWLESTPMLASLVADGVIGGVGSVVIFLPQILILFFFIALLEDTGYMARAAFLMDRMFSWCGLNGKSFVPMLSSYACAIPGVMATRTIEDPKARLVTILIAPLMSCSARLPVYVLLIGAFVEPRYGPWWAGFTLVAMHFVGLLVAIPVAMALNRWVIRGTRIPFVMEMPPYRTPQLRDVLWRMVERGGAFLRRAGTIIFAMTIIIWALVYFPRSASVEQAATQRFIDQTAAEMALPAADVADLVERNDADANDRFDEELAARLSNSVEGAFVEHSYLGRLGRTVQPIFSPAGFDWRITIGVLASFPAREVIIATLGIIYNLGSEVDEESDTLVAAMRNARWESGPRAGEPVFTIPVAAAIMVFFALCLQCGSTVAVIARESAWKWAIFAFCYMTALAWVGAVLTYQTLRLVIAS